MTELARIVRSVTELRVAYTPWSPGITAGWTVPSVRSTLADHELGNLGRSAMLADAMGRDDRLSGTLDVLISGVLGLPFEMQPAEEGGAPAEKLAETLKDNWFDIVPEPELAALLRWYFMLGVAVGELVWETGAAEWTPRLRVHHPQYVYYDETVNAYRLSTQEGTIEITPGDGKWVLLTDGERGYMNGLVRPLSIPWMVRTFAWRDWARSSERHGMPILLAGIPEAAITDEKGDFVNEIKRLASETVVPLPKFSDGQGFTLEMLEAKARDWEGFEKLITACNVSYAVRILGQNLTTEIQGGSYAAAGVHERILSDKLRAIVAKLSTTLYQQIARPVVAVNSGNLELTPWPIWNADPPEDQAQRAQVLATLIPALDNAERLGRLIDTEALFEQFGIPFLAEADRKAEPGKLFAYHLKYGAVSRDEVRGRIGFGPTKGGDELIVSPEMASARAQGLLSGGNGGQATLADNAAREDKTFADGTDYADQLAAQGVKQHASAIEPFIRKVVAAVEGAKDEDELERRLRELYDERDPKVGAELIRRARVLAQLAGRYAVAGEVG